MAFDDQGGSDFSPVQPGVQQAAQQELTRRQGLQDQQTQAGKSKLSMGGGIVGAILGGFMGGPGGAMAGYNAGKGLMGSAVGAQGSSVPGIDSMQTALGMPPAAPGAPAPLGMQPKMTQDQFAQLAGKAAGGAYGPSAAAQWADPANFSGI